MYMEAHITHLCFFFYMKTQMLNGFFICVLHGDKSGPRIILRLEDLLIFETLFKKSGGLFVNYTPLDKRRGSKLKQCPPRIFIKVLTFFLR
jgi:hypothetical protein